MLPDQRALEVLQARDQNPAVWVGVCIMRNALCAVAMLVAGLGACSMPDLKPDPALIERSEHIYEDLVLAKDDAVLKAMPAEYRTDQQRKLIAAIRALIPDGRSSPGKLVGWRNNSTTSGQAAIIIQRYDYSDQHVLMTAQFARKTNSEPWALYGFNLAIPDAATIAAPSIGPDGPTPPMKPKAASPV
jgi:hypothetical protein